MVSTISICELGWLICFLAIMLSIGEASKYSPPWQPSEQIEVFFWKCLGCNSWVTTIGNFFPSICAECNSDQWKLTRRARMSYKQYDQMTRSKTEINVYSSKNYSKKSVRINRNKTDQLWKQPDMDESTK